MNGLTSATQGEHTYVLDGGSLLHCIKWKKKSTYQEIADSYPAFVTKTYGQATFIFDGHPSGPSTKDNTHLRRTAQGQSKQFNFTPVKFEGIRKRVRVILDSYPIYADRDNF